MEPRSYCVRIYAAAAGAALLACAESHDVLVDDGSGTDSERPVIDGAGCRPGADALIGGGRRALPCRGECSFELALSSVFELGSGQCTGFRASLSVASELNVPLYKVTADLTDEVWDRVAVLGSRLRSEPLAPRYGCPGCAGGGEAWIATQFPGAVAQQHLYPSADPPPVLAEVDALFTTLIDQLRTCRGAALATCRREPAN